MKLWKPKDIDVTGGPLFSSIVRYSIPVMLATFLQTLFNAVDIMVLGNMADKVAVASVGATSVIVSLCVMAFVGLSAGTSILLSRYFGAGKEDYVKKTVGTSLWFAFGLGILLSAVAIPLATPFLRLTSCPEECVAAARLYLVIYFCAIPAIMLYNFGSAILNSIGDTQRPLFYLIISGVTNVVLNILLCLILTEKVAAVAIATFASQLIGAICVLIRLGHISGACRVNYREVPFDRHLLGKILIHGGPCAFTTAMYPLSNLMIQSAINRLGTAAMSGNVASGSIEGFVNAFTGAFAVCTLTFLGQNLGRENKERVWKTLLYCSLLAVVCIGAGDKSVIHRVMRRGVKHAVEDQHPRRFVKLVFFLTAFGDLHHGDEVGRANSRLVDIAPDIHSFSSFRINLSVFILHDIPAAVNKRFFCGRENFRIDKKFTICFHPLCR